jgi:hypothetical protein
VRVKCRSEDWFYFLINILCMHHTEMNHTAKKDVPTTEQAKNYLVWTPDQKPNQH